MSKARRSRATRGPILSPDDTPGPGFQMAKLNQILAIEKDIKTRVYAEFTELHQATQKPTLMNGFHKSYQPRDEDGETYPSESQKVQHNAAEVLERVGKSLTELFDITAAKDWANCTARATRRPGRTC